MANNFTNLYLDTLQSTYTSGDTTLAVSDASPLTAPVYLTIFDRKYGNAANAYNSSRAEIVLCTSIATNDLTVTRGQGGTSAIAFDGTGDWSVVASLTVDDLNDKQDVLSEGAFVDGDKTKLDGIESGADVTDSTNVDAAGAVMNSDASVSAMSFGIDEDDMSSDSDTKFPTQQSVKAYVDESIDEDWTQKSVNFTVNTSEELNYVNTSVSNITATIITGLNQIYVFRQGGAGTITLDDNSGAVTLIGDTATVNQHDRIIMQPTETADTYYCKLVPAS